MNANQKGNVGTSQAAHWFIRNGYEVSIPFGDCARYDMVIEKNGKFKTVQCKFTSSIHPKDGVYRFKPMCMRGKKRVPYREKTIDFFFITCTDDKMYLIPGKEFWGKKDISLTKKYNKYEVK